MGPPLLPGSQEPQRPRDWSPPQPAARLAGPRAKLELVRPPAPAQRPHRRRRRARLTTGPRLYCELQPPQARSSSSRDPCSLLSFGLSDAPVFPSSGCLLRTLRHPHCCSLPLGTKDMKGLCEKQND